MSIKQSELNKKWYYRLAKVLFWVFQVAVLIAILYNGGGIVDLIFGFAIYCGILIGIWKVIIYVSFGKVEKDVKSNKPQT